MKSILSFLAVILSMTAIAQRDYAFVYQSDSIISRGIALHDKEKFAEAIAEYDKIVPADPKYFTALYEKGMSLSQIDSIEVGKFYEDLYKRDLMKKVPIMYVNYGSYLSDRKRFDEADKIFTEARQYLPNMSNLFFNHAILKLRKDERQKMVDLLKETITINPNQVSAHYFLALMAYESGRVTEGSLAMLSYLVVAPTGRYAEDAISKLNQKFGENFLAKDALVYSPTGDNFSEIDEILRNQLPLQKAYKVNSVFDDEPIMRQMQAICEYAVDHKIGDGFFENTYIPWIKDVMKRKLFENLSYYILISKEEQLGKKLVAQKKKIEAFSAYRSDGFWSSFATRKIEHFGKPQTVVISTKNYRPYLIGAIINGKKEGKYKMLDEYGNVSGILNFQNDLGEGLQQYFDTEGKLTGESNFANGKLNGVKKEYYRNGLPSYIQSYKDDKLQGLATSYYVNGGKQCESNFLNDEREGKQICLFPNGSVKSEDNYIGGKNSGMHVRYNEVGDITEKYLVKLDNIDGPYVTYYNGKVIKEEANYVNGKVNGIYKSYFPNGAIDEERTFVKDNLKKILSYWANGKLESEKNFDDKGKTENYVIYDSDEKKFYEARFRGDDFKNGLQYKIGQAKPTELPSNAKPYKVFLLDGTIFFEGYFNKSEKDKSWSYYNAAGILKLNENFNNGKLEGLTTYYNQNGTLSSKKYYKNNDLNGSYDSYSNGVLSGQYYFLNDKQNGPHTSYNADGTKYYDGFTQNGEENYIRTYYRYDGSISDKIWYIDDVVVQTEAYDRKGILETTQDYKNKTGKFSYKINEGTTTLSKETVNGELNGMYTLTDINKTPVLEEEYKNGVNVNSYKKFGPKGTLLTEADYYCGKAHGPLKRYDLLGNLRSLETYVFGESYGAFSRYYQNKSKLSDKILINGYEEGEVTYYNLAGTPVLKIGYNQGKAEYYIKLSSYSSLSEKVVIVKQSADIVSNYPNGKKACSFKLVKGSFEGQFYIGMPDGKPCLTTDYAKDFIEGERIEYYLNGKIYKHERFKNGDYEGLQEYFSEDAKPLLTANYKNDRLHGDTVIFNKTGKTTKKYDTDELVEIKL